MLFLRPPPAGAPRLVFGAYLAKRPQTIPATMPATTGATQPIASTYATALRMRAKTATVPATRRPTCHRIKVSYV